MYSVTSEAPAAWAYGNGATGTYSATSAFWAFNVVSNYAYPNYNVVADAVTAEVVATEASLMKAVASADGTAAALLKSKGQAAANAFLSNFSISTAEAVVEKWVDLFPKLFVKYRDGLKCPPPPPPASKKDLPPPPACNAVGYDDEWYARVAKESGPHFLLPSAAGVGAGGVDGGSSDTFNAYAQRKLALLQRR